MLDLDVTDNELHGKQEGRFYQGHYDCYCCLPLYIYCGDDLLCVKLRTADVDPAEGVAKELDRIVGLIRSRWKHVQIVIRADSGFCREDLLLTLSHRQFVWTIPKVLRVFLRHDRELFADLSRLLFDILTSFFSPAALRHSLEPPDLRRVRRVTLARILPGIAISLRWRE